MRLATPQNPKKRNVVEVVMKYVEVSFFYHYIALPVGCIMTYEPIVQMFNLEGQ